MKRHIPAWVITLALAAGLLPLQPALGAQKHNQFPSENPPDAARKAPGAAKQPGAQQKQDRQKTRIYYGKIIKTTKGKYALMINSKTHKGYYLDDQKDARKYAQKKVLVKGSVNAQTSMMHVVSIRPASH